MLTSKRKIKDNDTYYYAIKGKKDLGFFVFSRILITITLIIVIFPILYIFSLSLRTKDTIFNDILYLIPKEVTFQNYVDAYKYAETNLNVTFLEMFRNSIIVAFISIIITLIVASLASFSFSHYRFKGKEITFTAIISLFVIPSQALLIPLFFVLKNLSLIHIFVVQSIELIRFKLLV